MKLPVSEIFEFVRNGLSVQHELDSGGLPITRIETIAHATINLERVGYAGIAFADAKQYILQDGDILFSHINSVSHLGKCAIYNKELGTLVHGMNLLCFRVKSEKLHPKFALYLIRSNHFKSQLAKSIKKSVNQASVSTGDIKKIILNIPPLAEQQRVAELLDTADRILQQRESAIAKLDEFAQSVFVDMFGDPVKNTKNFPIENIGELPIHIADGNYSSKYPSASEFVDSGIPFIRANNLKNLTLVNDDVRYITEKKHIELAKGHLKFRDVVIVTRGEIGKVGLVPKEFDDANMNAQLVLLRPNSSMLMPEYLCHFFNNNYTKTYVKNFETGVALKQLPIGNLKKIKICIPPIALQNKFANIVKTIESQIEFQNNQKFIINSLLSSLQHQLFAVN
jgi:type I restriction enzyme S subunit